MAAAKKKLAYNVHVVDDDGNVKVFGPDSDLPEWARKKITNPSAWGDDVGDEPAVAPAAEEPEPDTGDGDEADGGDGSEEVDSYDELSVKELKAEVAARNADRDEDSQIVVSGKGNKPDLVKALEADDEANGE